MSTCHIFIYAGIGLISMGGCRMSTPASGMEDALSQAGNNRNEWFRVQLEIGRASCRERV